MRDPLQYQLLIRNYDQLANSPAHSVALDCIEAGIRATLPARIIAESVRVADGVLHVTNRMDDLSNYDDVLVVGGGNAASQVAGAFEDQLGTILTSGAVLTDDPAERTAVEVRPAPIRYRINRVSPAVGGFSSRFATLNPERSF